MSSTKVRSTDTMKKSHFRNKILLVIGTRPEAIKLAPLVRELEFSFECVLVSTSQHSSLLHQTMQSLDLKFDFEIEHLPETRSLANLTSHLITKISDVIDFQKVSYVVVQGDTTSAFAGAYSAFIKGVPVVHVEAGLRTGDLTSPFPEEANRRMIAALTTIHCAPSIKSKENLISERINEKNIVMCGNTIVDSVQHEIKSAAFKNVDFNYLDIDLLAESTKYVVLTIHRRESLGETLTDICDAVLALCDRYPEWKFIIPVHPNPIVKKMFSRVFKSVDNVVMLDPLDYHSMLKLIENSQFLITDSGGLQEEAACFRKLTVIVREKTERMESVDCGLSIIAGVRFKNIVTIVSDVIDTNAYSKIPCSLRNPYGDGLAAKRIVSKMNEISGE